MSEGQEATPWPFHCEHGYNRDRVRCHRCEAKGREATPHTPSCHWYEQAKDGTESCDCGAAGREATACGCPEEALIRSHVEGCPWFTAFVEAGRGATSLDDLLLCQMCRHPDHDDQPCEGCQHGHPLPEEDDDA